MSAGNPEGIAGRALRGLAWAYGSYAGGRVLTLVSTAILARLLAPSDFGLVALALTFIALLETLSDLGVSQALVIVKRETEEKAETVFAISVAVGAVLALLVALCGLVAAPFFDAPELRAILPVLGLNLLIRSLGTTHYALAQKSIEFRSRTAAELGDVVARGVVGIALSLAGFGAWSLVIGYVAGSVIFSATLFTLVPWRPRFSPRRRDVRELMSFGGTLTLVNILAALIANVDYLIVARVLGQTALGLYSLAFRLPELLVLNLSVVAGRVLFPAFATLDPPALGRAFLMSLRYTLVISLPLATVLVLLAAPVIDATFGGQWNGSVDSMRLLALYALSITVAIPAGSAYKATGRANVLLILAIPRAVALVVAVLLVVDQGILAVAICQTAVACVFDAIGIVLASRLLGVGLRAIFAASWAPVVAAAGMATVVLGIDVLVDGSVPTVLIAPLVGGVAYLGLIRLLLPDVFAGVRSMLRPVPPPPPPSPGGEPPQTATASV